VNEGSWFARLAVYFVGSVPLGMCWISALGMSAFCGSRRAVASVTRCELTFRRKLILRMSTAALRWKKGEGLPVQPGQSDDGAKTATTREIECDNLVLSGAVEMTVSAKAQPTRLSKLGNI
jgi:hypothetical protein